MFLWATDVLPPPPVNSVVSGTFIQEKCRNQTVGQYGLHNLSAADVRQVLVFSSYHTPAMLSLIYCTPLHSWLDVCVYTTLCNMCAFWEAAYFQVPCSSGVSSEKKKQTVHRQREVLIWPNNLTQSAETGPNRGWKNCDIFSKFFCIVDILTNKLLSTLT